MKKIGILLCLSLATCFVYFSCTKEDFPTEVIAQDGQSISLDNPEQVAADYRGPGNGRGRGGNNNATFSVDLVAGHISGAILSSVSGETDRHMNAIFETGSIEIISSDGSLSYGPAFSVHTNSQGEVQSLQFWIKKAPGKSNPLYSTGLINLSPPLTPVSDDFTVHIDGVHDLWRLKKWNGGQQIVVVANVAFGDLHFVKQ